MWQFDYTLPSLILQIYITILFYSRRRLHVLLNRVYVCMLWANILTLCLDYFSSAMDNEWELYAPKTLLVVNTLFFLSFIVRAFLFYLFTLVLLNQWGRRSLFCILSLILPMAAMIVLVLTSPVTGLIFRITSARYVSGPLYDLINTQVLYCGIMILIAFLRGHKTAPSVRKNAGVLYGTILITGSVIRHFFPFILVMNMFCMFANAVILLEYLNPERFTDLATGLFNTLGWRQTRDEIISPRGRKRYWMAGFAIRDFNGLRDVYGDRQMGEGARLVGEYLLSKFPDINAYYVGEGRFLLMREGSADGEAVLDKVRGRFIQHWRGEHADLILPIGTVRFDPSDTDREERTAPGFLRYVLSLAADPKGSDQLLADRELLSRYQRTIYVRKCLNHAIQNDEIEMFLQPLVRATDGSLAGCEALARLRDSEGKLIGPNEFIPVAESNGMIADLGEQMFRKACAFMSNATVQESSLQWINVNLSPIQCVDASLADTYMDIYRAYHLQAGSVVLEVTEQSLTDSSVLHRQMVRLKEVGIPFVLDDFGSMSSNLERLKDNPFIGVKLDKDMVWSYMKSPDAIVPHAILACHEMGLRVTAEGIENEEMASVFRDLQCDHFQGYLYSKPIPEEAFMEKYCGVKER